METIFMKMENSKSNEPYKLVLNLLQKIGFKKLEETFCFYKLVYLFHMQKN